MIGSGVSVVAAAMVPFGERFESSYEDLMIDVWGALLGHPEGKLTNERIEAAWLSTALGGLIRREAVTGASLADPLGFFPRPVTRIENACAGGSDAIRNAAFAVAAGVYDVVVVLGVEKMRDLPTKVSSPSAGR
jgi:acetyl-CoA C-acetyltransferase